MRKQAIVDILYDAFLDSNQVPFSDIFSWKTDKTNMEHVKCVRSLSNYRNVVFGNGSLNEIHRIGRYTVEALLTSLHRTELLTK